MYKGCSSPCCSEKGDRRQLPRGKPSTAPYLQNTKILYKEPPIFLVVSCTIFCPYGIPLNQLRSTHLEEMQMLPNMPHFYFYINFTWRLVYQIKIYSFCVLGWKLKDKGWDLLASGLSDVMPLNWHLIEFQFRLWDGPQPDENSSQETEIVSKTRK